MPQEPTDDDTDAMREDETGNDGIDEPVTAEDASCCLLFQGGDAESSGRYLPHGYTLNLNGSEVAQHHVTHLHEIHHKVLNDETAWGALIHLAAEHPGRSPAET